MKMERVRRKSQGSSTTNHGSAKRSAGSNGLRVSKESRCLEKEFAQGGDLLDKIRSRLRHSGKQGHSISASCRRDEEILSKSSIKYINSMIVLLGQDEEAKRSIERLEDIFKPLDKQEEAPTRIFVQGEHGYGKTTICQTLAFHWAAKKEYMKQFDLVLLYKLRELKGKPVCEGVIDVIKKIVGSDLQKADIEELFNTLGNKFLLLLDGLGELCGTEETVSTEILFQSNNSPLSRSTILVTGRPSSFKTCDFKDSVQRHLCLRGFSPSQQKDYVLNFFREKDPEVGRTREVLELITTHDGLEDIARSPLILYMTCQLFRRKELSTYSKGGLYYDLVKYLARKCSEKYRYPNGSNCVSGQEMPMAQIILAWGKLSLQMLSEKKVTLSLVEINEVFAEKTCVALNLGLFQSASEDMYEPMHSSMMDFLAALYLVIMLTPEDYKYLASQPVQESCLSSITLFIRDLLDKFNLSRAKIFVYPVLRAMIEPNPSEVACEVLERNAKAYVAALQRLDAYEDEPLLASCAHNFLNKMGNQEALHSKWQTIKEGILREVHLMPDMDLEEKSEFKAVFSELHAFLEASKRTSGSDDLQRLTQPGHYFERKLMKAKDENTKSIVMADIEAFVESGIRQKKDIMDAITISIRCLQENPDTTELRIRCLQVVVSSLMKGIVDPADLNNIYLPCTNDSLLVIFLKDLLHNVHYYSSTDDLRTCCLGMLQLIPHTKCTSEEFGRKLLVSVIRLLRRLESLYTNGYSLNSSMENKESHMEIKLFKEYLLLGTAMSQMKKSDSIWFTTLMNGLKEEDRSFIMKINAKGSALAEAKDKESAANLMYVAQRFVMFLDAFASKDGKLLVDLDSVERLLKLKLPFVKSHFKECLVLLLDLLFEYVCKYDEIAKNINNPGYLAELILGAAELSECLNQSLFEKILKISKILVNKDQNFNSKDLLQKLCKNQTLFPKASFKDLVSLLHTFISNRNKIDRSFCQHVISMCRKICTDERFAENACLAAKLLEVLVLENPAPPSRMDDYVKWCIDVTYDMQEENSSENFRFMCNVIFAAALYKYSPYVYKVIDKSTLNHFITELLNNIHRFNSCSHNRKLGVLCLCTIIRTHEGRPEAVAKLSTVIIPLTIKLLNQSTYTVTPFDEFTTHLDSSIDLNEFIIFHEAVVDAQMNDPNWYNSMTSCLQGAGEGVIYDNSGNADQKDEESEWIHL